MEIVAFINTTKSKKRDLLLTFAIEDGRWPGGVRSLVLLRCPAFESMFEEDERGISVSMEGQQENRNDIKGSLLSEFTLDESAKTITLKTPKHSYRLDIGKLKPESLASMREFLATMNFDGKAKVTGV